jgi:hypothetical protein
MTTPIRVEVCCDPACENYNVAQEIALTAQEIAAAEALAVAAAEEQAAREAEAGALAALKASARAKLVAGTPLTEEEAATLVI